MKSPKPINKAQRKVDYKNYNAITMSRNYDTNLCGEIITGNYELVYNNAENVEIIGILAYPKNLSFHSRSVKINFKFWQFLQYVHLEPIRTGVNFVLPCLVVLYYGLFSFI